jgi:hypothetical protein
MLRVTAYIEEQHGDVYKVVAEADGIAGKFTFEIKASSDDEAAREAIRRVERFDKASKTKGGTH